MNIYEAMTERIISQLDKGVVPWRQEWKGGGMPRNIDTNKPYRGINVLSLLCSGYTSSRWATYKQAQSIGAQVRKGEQGTPVVYWNTYIAKDDKTGEDVERGFSKLYFVFNEEQLDGLQPKLDFAETPQFNPIESAQRIADSYLAASSHPTLEHGGDRAYYIVARDHVQMPQQKAFKSASGYYSTLFHEFAHSTGHHSRLDRYDHEERIAAFGSADYSKEELVAEFTAAFLCGESGIASDAVVVNSTAYIQGWLSKLRSDKKLAVSAAQKAQHAADFILGRNFTREVLA